MNDNEDHPGYLVRLVPVAGQGWETLSVEDRLKGVIRAAARVSGFDARVIRVGRRAPRVAGKGDR